MSHCNAYGLYTYYLLPLEEEFFMIKNVTHSTIKPEAIETDAYSVYVNKNIKSREITTKHAFIIFVVIYC